MTQHDPTGPSETGRSGPAPSNRTRGRSRTVPVAVMVAGAVLLAVCILLVTGQRQLPTAFGALPAAAPAVLSTTSSSTSAASSAPAPSTPAPFPVRGSVAPASPTAPPVPVESPFTTAGTQSAVAVPDAPSTVTLTDQGVSAPVVELLAQDGVLHPPTDPAVVGWWAASALVGATSGSTVIVGHVDSADAGLGALAGLSDLRAGSRIDVGTGSGTAAYSVTALLVLDKGAGLPADLFTRTGPPRLVLITCGGPFDEATLSYRDNVVVLADPA